MRYQCFTGLLTNSWVNCHNMKWNVLFRSKTKHIAQSGNWNHHLAILNASLWQLGYTLSLQWLLGQEMVYYQLGRICYSDNELQNGLKLIRNPEYVVSFEFHCSWNIWFLKWCKFHEDNTETAALEESIFKKLFLSSLEALNYYFYQAHCGRTTL